MTVHDTDTLEFQVEKRPVVKWFPTFCNSLCSEALSCFGLALLLLLSNLVNHNISPMKRGSLQHAANRWELAESDLKVLYVPWMCSEENDSAIWRVVGVVQQKSERHLKVISYTKWWWWWWFSSWIIGWFWSPPAKLLAVNVASGACTALMDLTLQEGHGRSWLMLDVGQEWSEVIRWYSKVHSITHLQGDQALRTYRHFAGFPFCWLAW